MEKYSKLSQLGSKQKEKKAKFGERKNRGDFGNTPPKKPLTRTAVTAKKRSTIGKSKAGMAKGKTANHVTRGELHSMAQQMFNAFIRLRDEDEPCISCNNEHEDYIYHAGHYKSVGAHPELRFNEDNCHNQCSYCNTSLYGNPREYRIRLTDKIGADRMKVMLNTESATGYTSSELLEIIRKYRMQSNRDFSEKEIQTGISVVIDRIRQDGVDTVINTGQVTTHKSTMDRMSEGVEAIVSLNPEIRIDTSKKEVYGFTGHTEVSSSYLSCS